MLSFHTFLGTILLYLLDLQTALPSFPGGTRDDESLFLPDAGPPYRPSTK